MASDVDFEFFGFDCGEGFFDDFGFDAFDPQGDFDAAHALRGEHRQARAGSKRKGAPGEVGFEKVVVEEFVAPAGEAAVWAAAFGPAAGEPAVPRAAGAAASQLGRAGARFVGWRRPCGCAGVTADEPCARSDGPPLRTPAPAQAATGAAALGPPAGLAGSSTAGGGAPAEATMEAPGAGRAAWYDVPIPDEDVALAEVAGADRIAWCEVPIPDDDVDDLVLAMAPRAVESAPAAMRPAPCAATARRWATRSGPGLRARWRWRRRRREKRWGRRRRAPGRPPEARAARGGASVGVPRPGFPRAGRRVARRGVGGRAAGDARGDSTPWAPAEQPRALGTLAVEAPPPCEAPRRDTPHAQAPA